MKVAFYFTYKKNRWFLVSVILLFIIIKGVTIFYVSEKSSSISPHQNVQRVKELIAFAENKEGVLPAVLPPNYMELLDFYKSLEEPQIINESILDNYFELQQYSIVILIVTILTTVFWGQHYELEIYKYVATTKKGSIYNRGFRFFVFAISYCFLLLNELVDLQISGLFQNIKMLFASAQSYSAFAYVQSRVRLIDCFGIAFVSKIVGILILSNCFEFIAQRKKNVRDTAIFCVCLLFILFFVKQAFMNTNYYSLIQIGIVNWKEVIENTVRFVHVKISTLELGCILTCVIGIGTSIKKKKDV